MIYNLRYNLYLAGLKKNIQSPINKVLLTSFLRQKQKLLGFWVFFVELQCVLQLTLKQIMFLVLEKLVIHGTNVWNRLDLGFLHNPLLH